MGVLSRAARSQHEVSPGGCSSSGPRPLLCGGDEEAEEEQEPAAGASREAGGAGGGGGGEGGECTEDELECLRQVIPGEPKEDYPIYSTSILCKLNPKNPGCPGFGK